MVDRITSFLALYKLHKSQLEAKQTKPVVEEGSRNSTALLALGKVPSGNVEGKLTRLRYKTCGIVNMPYRGVQEERSCDKDILSDGF